MFHILYFDNILSPLVTPPRSFLPSYPPKFMFSLSLSPSQKTKTTKHTSQTKTKE